MDGFTKLELAALQSIFSETPEFAEQLLHQLACAEVLKRTNAGGGFFTDIRVSEAEVLVDCGNALGVQTYGEVGGLEYGMGFILFIKDGRFTLLEGYAVGPEDTSPIDFEQVDFRIYREEAAQLR